MTIVLSHPPQRRSFQIDPPRLVFMGLLVIVGIFVLYPVIVTILNSFVAGEIGQARTWSLAPWQNAVSDPGIRAALWNTVRVVAANELISMPIAVMLAWLLGRTDLPGRRFLEFMFWISFFLPSLSVTIGWIVLLDPQTGVINQIMMKLFGVAPFDIYTFWGIVWAHLATASISVKVMLLTPAFRAIDGSFEEAARVSGGNRWQTLTRVVFPVALPAIATVLVLSIIRAMQTFEIEMVLGPPTNFWVFGTMIYRQIEQMPPQFASATSLATMTFAIILPLIVLHRWMIMRKDYTSVSGRIRLKPTPLGRLRYPLFILIALLTCVLTILPVSFVLIASFMKLFGFFNINDPWTLANWSGVISDDFFDHSLLTTIQIAAGSAFLSVFFCTLTAYFAVRSRYAGRGVLDFLSWLPFAIPGILLGVGMLSVVLSNPLLRPLYGTVALLIIAVTVAHMTLGTQIMKAAILQLDKGMEEAARTSGASWWHSFRKIIMPTVAPTLVLVGITSFIGASRDIASVALLATNDAKPLSLLQLDYIIDGRSEAATVISVIVILLTTGIALLSRLVGLGSEMKH